MASEFACRPVFRSVSGKSGRRRGKGRNKPRFPAKAVPEVKHMQSIWSKTAELPPHPPLPGDLKVEAAVIGGGMAGILTACLLQEKGVESVVLEAERIGGGQTKNTTAKITSQHGLIYARADRKIRPGAGGTVCPGQPAGGGGILPPDGGLGRGVPAGALSGLSLLHSERGRPAGGGPRGPEPGSAGGVYPGDRAALSYQGRGTL